MSSAAYADAPPNIISRAEWGARPPKKPAGNMGSPAKLVVIHHSAGDPASDTATCMQRVRGFQNSHMDERKWDDIGYNFVVGEDGNVYTGRDWGKIGAHAKGYNAVAIGICIIGTYNTRVPNEQAITAIKRLVSFGVGQGHIISGYTLKGHRDLGATECPGTKLYDLIRTWPHYQ